MPAVLEFHDIGKRYRGFPSREERWALRGFSLAVEPGEIVGFLGPNGAGKTTAIHIALGLARATSGGGSVLGHAFGDKLARRRIGFLSENPAFYHRSARQVLKFCGALNGMREPGLSRRADELLEALGLSADANRNIGKFSRGMLQRVGLAQALINDPELLILDEPTSALDPISRLQVREALLSSRRQGKSVFLSSHQLSEIELVCDRVFFIRDGRVIASGRTHELLESGGEFEIVGEGISQVPEGARHVESQNGRITFLVPASTQRSAIEHVWTAGGTIVSVSARTQTLEELFVKLMNENRKPQ